MANLEKLEAVVDQKAMEYRKAYSEHLPKKKLKEYKDGLANAISEYNEALETKTYKDWNTEGNAVLTGIRTRYIPNALKLTMKEDDSGELTITKVFKSDFLTVDLLQMKKILGAEVFSNPKWYTMTQKLCYIVANRVSHDLGRGTILGDIEEDAKAFDFGKNDPLSDKGIVKALQQVYDAICFVDNGGKNNIAVDENKDEGDKRAYSKQWTYIRESMTRKAGIGDIEVTNTAKFADLICDAMYLAATNGTIACSVSK